MRLLIYDKFWDSFLKLNATTQKKVVDFQKKFRENSKSAAIHLEPISTFKDPTLRTARIDQKYRAIIKAPESGSNYYLLWVDNHDEAMDWARNKVMRWNETTQAMQIYSISEEEIIVPTASKETIESKSILNVYSDEQLEKIGIPTVLMPSVRQVQNMDDLEKLESFLPVDAFENLFYLIDGADIDRLITEVKEGFSSATDPDGKATSINNQRSFIELTDDEVFNDVLQGGMDKWKYYLHPSQRKLVEGEFRGPVKISGGAGTGKTVAALHRLKFLSDRATVSQPVLFTTFTKNLTQNLKKLAEELDIPKDKIYIDNIDALAFTLAKKHQLIADHHKVFGLSASKSSENIWEELLEKELIEYDQDFLQAEYEQILLYHNIQDLQAYLRISRIGRGTPLSRRQRMSVWNVLEKYRSLKNNYNHLHKEEIYNMLSNYLKAESMTPFYFVIADELQDFSNVELRFLRALVEEKPNDLFFVGDPFQTIYDRRINFTQAGINVRGKRSRKLRINYRTTEEIKKLAISIVEDTHYDDFDGEAENLKGYISLFHGLKPTYQTFKSKNEEVEYAKQWIEERIENKDGNNGYKYAELAIAARTHGGLKDFRDMLHKENIPYYESHGRKESGDVSGLRLLTFHSIKGLEFQHVLLVDVNKRTCPLPLPENQSYDESVLAQHAKSEKSLLYVASSRAIKSLTITGIGLKSELVKL